jgi:hypothetical protein
MEDRLAPSTKLWFCTEKCAQESGPSIVLPEACGMGKGKQSHDKSSKRSNHLDRFSSFSEFPSATASFAARRIVSSRTTKACRNGNLS